MRLSGGRVEYARPYKHDTENLIYKIDDHRYFTMLTEKGNCEQGGHLWYHDTQRNIQSDVGSSNLFRFPYSIDGDQYLAIPSNRAIEGSFSTVHFSKDYGQTWRATPMFGDGPSAFTKDMFVQYAGGVNDHTGLIELGNKTMTRTVDFHYINFGSPKHLDRARIEDRLETGSMIYEPAKKRTFTMYSARGGVNIYTQIEFDGEPFVGIKTPSGWNKFRCDPMPKDLQGVLK